MHVEFVFEDSQSASSYRNYSLTHRLPHSSYKIVAYRWGQSEIVSSPAQCEWPITPPVADPSDKLCDEPNEIVGEVGNDDIEWYSGHRD